MNLAVVHKWEPRVAARYKKLSTPCRKNRKNYPEDRRERPEDRHEPSWFRLRFHPAFKHHEIDALGPSDKVIE